MGLISRVSSRTYRIMLRPTLLRSKYSITKHTNLLKSQQFYLSTSTYRLPPSDYPESKSLQLGEYEKIPSKNPVDVVNITVIDRDGDANKLAGKIGDNLMFMMQHNDIEIEGACEASLACCTCHVYVDEDKFDLLEEPEEDEDDMLDLAPFLKENSRLGCQILLNHELEGMVVTIPSATRNFYVDGATPHSHH